MKDRKLTTLEIGRDLMGKLNRKGIKCSKQKIQNLLYLSQIWHLELYNNPLFEDDIYALKEGPGAYTIWKLKKGCSQLDGDELNSDLLRSIVNYYGIMDVDFLSKLTKDTYAWKKQISNNGFGDTSSISIELLKDTSRFKEKEVHKRFIENIKN
jgi:uncharacterized phage-associated protein